MEHLQRHANPDLFKCQQCGHVCNIIKDLRKHILQKHTSKNANIQKVACEICSKTFSCNSYLKEHMETHTKETTKNPCPHCSKEFAGERHLKKHIRRVHQQKSFVCEQCGCAFRHRFELNSHVQTAHEGVEKKKWPCDQCNAKLNTKYSMLRHKKLVHSNVSTIYKCGDCGKVSLSEEAMQAHKRYVHKLKRDHVCSICGKAFKTPCALKVVRSCMKICLYFNVSQYL